MIEVRFHGRGGQGVVLASEILANAAFFEGKEVQSFPFFGVERRGAPLVAFARISDGPIRAKFGVRSPDYVIVLDASLVGLVEVTSGVKPGALVFINAPPGLDVVEGSDFRTVVFDATSVSLRHGLGSRTAPIVNTAMLGAFAAATRIVQLESLERAIKEMVPGSPEHNAAACRDAYQEMMKEVDVLEG